MKIVGIFMVKNEDVYIEQAVRNVAEFCDIVYVDDNESSDQTPEILARLAKEFDHIHVRTITDTKQSNDNLVQYFDTDTWVFAVDGDELYDPQGLRDMRTRLEEGEFDDSWMIYGNCIHVTKFDNASKVATGFLSPPSKSMTKLYNFSLISDFPILNERLHGHPVFKDGNQNTDERKLSLNEQSPWEESIFRCSHMAFVKRSSTSTPPGRFFGMRLNPPQIYTLKKIWRERGVFYALPRTVKLIFQLWTAKDDRTQTYQQGKKETICIGEFFDH